VVIRPAAAQFFWKLRELHVLMESANWNVDRLEYKQNINNLSEDRTLSTDKTQLAFSFLLHMVP
jgi:hypothetical protein